MKKIISSLAGLLLAGNIVMAENVGDKMPEFFGRQTINPLSGGGTRILFYPYVDKDGKIIDEKNYEYAFAVSTAEGCGMMTPFAVFSYKKAETYLDDDGNGEIDMKIIFPNVKAGENFIKHIKPNCSALEPKKTSI